MAKKKAILWQPVSASESKGRGNMDKVLAWVSGLFLSAIILLFAIDLFDFLKDPSQHAIGQGSRALVDGWRQRYLLSSTGMILFSIVLLSTIIYAARNPRKRWTILAIRIISAVLVGIVVFGYITWMGTGFDH